MDLDEILQSDTPTKRAIATTSQLQQIISWVAVGQMPIAQFAFLVGMELGLFSDRDWEYLQKNGGVPSKEMVLKIVQKINGWQVMDCSPLYEALGKIEDG